MKGELTMNEKDFVAFCRKAVMEHVNEEIHKSDPVTEEEVYVVWLTKVLQNNKALLGTTRPDGLYYEITYDGDKKIAYVDEYIKVAQRVVVM